MLKMVRHETRVILINKTAFSLWTLVETKMATDVPGTKIGRKGICQYTIRTLGNTFQFVALLSYICLNDGI